jgi:hypothetical protein
MFALDTFIIAGLDSPDQFTWRRLEGKVEQQSSRCQIDHASNVTRSLISQ